MNFGFGQTTLAPGDIAITGFNSSSPYQLTFVLLKDVSNTTQISFTDNGWNSTDGLRDSEGTLTWQADSDLPCGTEISLSRVINSNLTVSHGSLVAKGSFVLSTIGDQILAYQGSFSSPFFIYTIHYGPSGWSDVDGNSNLTNIPPGLTDGLNAVYLGNNSNGNYLCSVTTNQSLILAAVSNATNWATGNTRYTTLGGCSFSCDPCPTSTTYTALGGWSNGTPNSLSKAVVIADDYYTSSGDITACSLTVKAGATLTVSNGTYVEVEHDVEGAGNIYVETTGAFVQKDDAGEFKLTGTASVNKQTPNKANWYYYTYWSSPVKDETIGNVFPDVDGDRRFWYNAANFKDEHTVGTTDGNPDDVDDNNNDWQYASAGTIMEPGVGYAVTEARTFLSGGTGTANFAGEFNTGNIPVTITFDPTNPGEKWNFIGNPYPCAVDFDAFYAANIGEIDGFANYWSQGSPALSSNPGNQQVNFNAGDYAIYAAAFDGNAGGAGIKPTQYIPSGQGFFVKANPAGTGTVTFTNAMRVKGDTDNSQFFKNTNTKAKTNATDANKLWVNLTSDNGVFGQILVGYVDGATDGYDVTAYDAPRTASEIPATLSWIIEGSNKKFVIQGKDANSINENEVIKLSFKTSINVATLYTISIDQLKGDFLNSNTIFLKDNLLNKTHNLSASDYTFTSAVGEFNSRFEITFSNQALSVEDIISSKHTLKIVELDNDNVQFNTSNNLSIKSVHIFDMLGRQLYSFKGDSTSETYKLSNLNNSVFIAKVELSNGAVITKKAFKK